MANFTPGPWQIEGPNLSYAREVYTLYTGTEVMPKWFADIQFLHKESAEGEANARLIAAAPDMYDMLYVLLNFAEYKDCSSHMPRRIQEILNKIDG